VQQTVELSALKMAAQQRRGNIIPQIAAPTIIMHPDIFSLYRNGAHKKDSKEIYGEEAQRNPEDETAAQKVNCIFSRYKEAPPLSPRDTCTDGNKKVSKVSRTVNP
jgi:hypothetical protein